MQEVCDVLEQLVQNGTIKNYALGGATAAGFYGEPLATRDIDVFVFLDAPPGSLLISLEPLYTCLREIGFSAFEEEGILIHGFPVQFLSAAPGLESEALEKALSFEWSGHRIRVMRPEHLAAIAVATGRPKDRARLVYLACLENFDNALFEQILATHHLLEIGQQWKSALGLP
jgi:hypothetical protein